MTALNLDLHYHMTVRDNSVWILTRLRAKDSEQGEEILLFSKVFRLGLVTNKATIL
jgi:hypothetical protein